MRNKSFLFVIALLIAGLLLVSSWASAQAPNPTWEDVFGILTAVAEGYEAEPLLTGIARKYPWPTEEARVEEPHWPREGCREIPGDSREHPVPFDTSFVTSDGFEWTIIDVNWDAWPEIEAENQYNDPPAEGNRMIVVRFRVTNLSSEEEPAAISGSDWELAGSRGVVYKTFDKRARCGVIPDELDAELFRGGSIEGNACWQVPKDETHFVAMYEPGAMQSERIFFAVGNPDGSFQATPECTGTPANRLTPISEKTSVE